MNRHEKDNKYEKMYDILLDYEKRIHERNQRRISIGLKCIWIIPLIFLFLLFWTKSSKIIFLILWIVSLFGIAMYLIAVEYMDYRLQEKLHELDDDAKISNLMVRDIDTVENAIRAAMAKLDLTLNAQEELKIEEKEEKLAGQKENETQDDDEKKQIEKKSQNSEQKIEEKSQNEEQKYEE